MHQFSRQDYSATHTHSNQIDISRKARVVLCAYCCIGNQHDTNEPRRGMVLTSKARSTLAPINSSNIRHDKARDIYSSTAVSSDTTQTHTLKAIRARAPCWKPSQHIAFAKEPKPCSQRLEAFELSNTPFQRHSSSSYSEIQSATAFSNGLCTYEFLTPHSASRSGYPRDDLVAQVGRLKHLAALGTITRFARDAAPSPSGRATRQPAIGTAESPHFSVFTSPACPPKALSPRDRRVCLCYPS